MENLFYTLKHFQKWVEENKDQYLNALRNVQANTYYIQQVIEAANQIWMRDYDIIFRHSTSGEIIEVEVDNENNAEIFYRQTHISLTKWTLNEMMYLEFDVLRMKDYNFQIVSKINDHLENYTPVAKMTARDPDPLFENQHIEGAAQ